MAVQVAGHSEAIRKLEEQVKCPVCLNTYKEPKLLQCSHVFCKGCLQGLSKSHRRPVNQSIPFSLTCPTCRELTSIVKDLTELQPAFQMNQTIDILRELKTRQNPSIVSETPTRQRAATEWSVSGCSTVSSEDSLLCSEPGHGREVCSLFCKTCNVLICAHCTIKEHHSHNYDKVSVEFEKSKVELASSLTQLDGMVQKLEELLSDIIARGNAITTQKAVIKTEVNSKMQSLHQVLDDRLAELVGELELVTERKLCSLEAEKDQVRAKLCPLRSFRDSIQETINTSSEEQLLKAKKSILKKVQQKTNTFQPECSVILTKADMKFSYSSYVNETCRNYGSVYAPGSLHPSKCHAEGEGLEKATAGVISVLELTILDYNGELCKEMVIESLDCKLVSEISGAILNGAVESIGCGQYTIQYIPISRGEHLLHIKVDGEHIRESPFAVKVNCPTENLGTPAHSITGLDHPCGVTFTSSRDVVIAEKGGQVISILSPSGQRLGTFDVMKDVGEVLHCGVAVDQRGNLLVVDTHKHCIRQFTLSGKFITEVGSMGNGILQFLFPHDIAFNATDNKFYIIDQNNRVQVLNSDLTFFRMFGKYGSGNAQFDTPHGIACDKSGKVYVADTNNHRIVSFTTRGKYLNKYVKSAKDICFSPVSVAVDANDYVYASEADNCISVFSPEGTYLVSFGKGSRPNELNSPFALSVHKNGMIYVCDTGNNRVQIY